MKIKMTKIIILGLAGLAVFTSCVPFNRMKTEKAQHEICIRKNDTLKVKVMELENTINDLADSNVVLFKITESLTLDTTICKRSLRMVTYNYEQINRTYELLIKEKKQLLEGNENDKKELEKELKNLQNEFLSMKQEFTKLTGEIENKKLELNNLKKELEESRKNLEEKENKLINLQNVLNRQDSIVNALKKNVSNALLGFENNGLTIKVKNNKVYVSLDENLLFAPASTVVDKKGVEALNKLAKVLEKNADINIMIEGHTDNVPYKGKGDIKDNWDLSVMRATSVAKILLKNTTIDKKRITVAGRGEFFPVDPANTPQARQKNRRTEIILTPKLDELFSIIESN